MLLLELHNFPALLARSLAFLPFLPSFGLLGFQQNHLLFLLGFLDLLPLRADLDPPELSPQIHILLLFPGLLFSLIFLLNLELLILNLLNRFLDLLPVGTRELRPSERYRSTAEVNQGLLFVLREGSRAV